MDKTANIGRALAFPGASITGLFIWIPLLIIGAYSFFESTTGASVSTSATLNTWRDVFSDGFYVQVLGHTLRTAVICTAICALLGYPTALTIVHTKGLTRGCLFGALVLPFWISYVVRMVSWTDLLAEHGLLNQLLLWTGLSDSPVKLLYTDYAVMIGLVYWLLPFMTINLYVNLEAQDQNVAHAARTLGASSWRAFWTITFPLSLPGLAAGSLICAILASGAYITPMLLGGTGSAYFGLLIYESLIQQLNWPLGAALAFIFFAIVAIAIVAVGRIIGFSNLIRRPSR